MFNMQDYCSRALVQVLARVLPGNFGKETMLRLWKAWWPHGSALNSRSSGPGSNPGQGHCVVFLGKTLYSHSASLHPGV